MSSVACCCCIRLTFSSLEIAECSRAIDGGAKPCERNPFLRTARRSLSLDLGANAIATLNSSEISKLIKPPSSLCDRLPRTRVVNEW